MKRLLIVLVVFLFLASCKETPTSPITSTTTTSTTTTTTVPAKANVVVIEGPIFEDGYSLFSVKGRVQNKGDATAKYAKITIYIRDSGSVLIAQEWSYIDDTDLMPNETSPWSVLFWDENKSIRNKMNFSKTTWEIKWD